MATIQIYGTLEGGKPAKLQEGSATPSIQEQILEPETGYDGFSKVTIAAVDNTIDANIIADNIRKDVTILGVTGTLEGGTIIPPEAGTLTSLVVGTLPTKTTYTEGEDLDLTGLVVLGNYSNGYQYDVTDNCTYTCNDPVTYYDTKIVASLDNVELSTVVLDNVTLDIPITVNGIPVQAPLSTIILSHFENNTNNYGTGGTAGTSNTKRYASGKFNLGYTGNNLAYTNFGRTMSAFATGNWTVEFWATASRNVSATTFATIFRALEMGYTPNTSTSTVNSTLTQYNRNSGANGYLFSTSYSTNNVEIKNLPTTQIPVGESHHVAWSVSAGHYKAFVDGILCGEGDLLSSFGRAIVQIGIYPYDQNFSLDEFMVCNEAKYSTNFEPNHAPYYMMYNVTFNVDGGSTIPNQLVKEGEYATQPTAPTKSGYVFDGWYKENTFTNAWNFATDKINKPTTIYAKWIEDTPSTVTLTYYNSTIYNPLNVTFITYDSTSELYSVNANETFTIDVPYAESLDTIYESVEVTDENSNPVTIYVLEDGQLEPTTGIDLQGAYYEDTGFTITAD